MLKNSYTILSPSLSYGGAESMAYQYAQYLEAKGHRVDFLLLEDKIDKKYNNHFPYHCLNSTTFRKSIFKLVLYKSRKDSIYISLIPAYTVCFIISRWLRLNFSTKFIFTIHNNIEFDFKRSLIDGLIKKVYLAHLKSSKNIYSVCDDLSSNISRINPNIKTLFNKSYLENHYISRNESNKLNIIMAGRLTEQKDYLKAIEFLNHINKAHIEFSVTIYGTGPMREIILLEASKHNLSNAMKINEYVDNLSQVYCNNKFDILLSTSKYEGFGLVILEAMQHGIFPIARDCDFGPRELITSSYGALIPFDFKETDTFEALEKWKKWIRKDPEERKYLANTHVNRLREKALNSWINLESYR